MIPTRRHSLSVQIVGSLVLVLILGVVSLVLVGRNAVGMADATAAARQERLAASRLADEIEHLPTEQQSATIWDDAVLKVRDRDDEWMDANLGSWMQDYFGHDENYVLDADNRPLFASGGKTRLPLTAYQDRADVIGPLARQLRSDMAKIGNGGENPYDDLATLSVVAAVQLEDRPAIVSVVPILTETGEVAQAPGTEPLHVAVRHVGADLAQRIGQPIELDGVAVSRDPPAEGQAGIPLSNPSGEPVAWLVWEPDRPAMKLLMKMLPMLLVSGLAVGLLMWWVIHRLLRVSGQLQVSEAQARFLANHDALTGLPNRALFQDRLTQALHALDRDGRSVALLAVDLDGFKAINDTLGHPAGDELIRQVGSRLSETLRAGDTVARFGGDEFMILLTDMVDDDALRRVCVKVVADLSRPYGLLGNFGSVSASVGAVRTRNAAEDPDALIQQADLALYQAKSDGKGRYNLYQPHLNTPAQNRNRTENDLRAALRTGTGLKLVYQPFYNERGEMTGAEALCRWDHPQLGELSPEIFIRVAEERGLIDELGRWALDKACHFAARTRLAKIAVNVSPLQLKNPDFVPMVLRTLEKADLAPTCLELELTEKAVLDRGREIEDTLIQLRASGIKIALDDFATGNSSLQYLRDHRIDCVKIDRTFVARLGKDPECDHLVQAIFGMARAMGISVTVEGVETEMQRGLLASMGCKTFQGFLLHSPMEQEQFAALLVEKTAEIA